MKYYLIKHAWICISSGFFSSSITLKAEYSISGFSMPILDNLTNLLYELGIVFNSGRLLVLLTGSSHCKKKRGGQSDLCVQTPHVYHVLLSHVFASEMLL